MPKPTRSTAGLATYVALMRGINVGGKNKLPMSDLSEMFNEAGCKNVRTYIASGNVVFSASAKTAERIAKVISDAVLANVGLRIPVVLRTARELQNVVAKNPYPLAATTPKMLYVAFLADMPDKKRAASLDPNRSLGDVYKLIGRDIYMHLGTGAADTKLTNAYFDSTLATISTARNWNTVLKLAEMSAEG